MQLLRSCIALPVLHLNNTQLTEEKAIYSLVKLLLHVLFLHKFYATLYKKKKIEEIKIYDYRILLKTLI